MIVINLETEWHRSLNAIEFAHVAKSYQMIISPKEIILHNLNSGGTYFLSSLPDFHPGYDKATFSLLYSWNDDLQSYLNIEAALCYGSVNKCNSKLM